MLDYFTSKDIATKIHIKIKTPNYADDIDDRVFNYSAFGKKNIRPDLSWEDAKRN